MNRNNIQTLARRSIDAAKHYAGRAAVGGSALVASGLAAAQATTPGGAISAELATGKSDVMLVVGAAAVIIGVLVLWSYVKRAR